MYHMVFVSLCTRPPLGSGPGFHPGRRGKVLGTGQCHTWNTRGWWKGIKPTVAILSRGISHPAGGWRPGQSWQRTGHCRSVVWARTKPPPPERYKLAGRWGPSPGTHHVWGGGSGGWHWWGFDDGWGSWGPPSKLSVPRAT